MFPYCKELGKCKDAPKSIVSQTGTDYNITLKYKKPFVTLNLSMSGYVVF